MLFRSKLPVPVLVYTPTPFRGLDVLLDAFPLIRARVPAARLRVHAGLGVYQIAETEDPHRDLYARCRAMAGVDYVGPVSQPALARSLKEALVFAYPSTFPETFCTSAIEAMAAGCLAVVGDLGALGETTKGLAELVPVPDDRGLYAEAFARHLSDLLAEASGLEARLATQRRRLLAEATWARRAETWSEFLLQARRGKSGATTRNGPRSPICSSRPPSRPATSTSACTSRASTNRARWARWATCS